MFVKEALKDILKPKDLDPKVLKDYLDRVRGRAKGIWEDILLAGDDTHHGKERLMQSYQEIDNWFYELPEFVKMYTDLDHLHEKLHNLLRETLANFRMDELLITEQKKLNLSAGFVIIQDNMILLAHPTNSKWQGTYSIPKGHLEEGEDFLDAALRETKEEVGIDIDPNDVVKGPHFIDYIDKNNKLYKRVYYYVAKPSVRIEQKDIMLQKSEVDWAGFLPKEEAQKRIFWRLREVLHNLK